MDYQECCGILDLVPPVTLEDAKQAYKDLVQVWHPDRFTHSPRLQARAEQKLKQLNLAYETLEPLLRSQKEIQLKNADRKAQQARADRDVRRSSRSQTSQTSQTSREATSREAYVWDMASAYHDAMGSKRWFDRLSLRTKARIYGILFLPVLLASVTLILWLATLLAAYPQILLISIGASVFYYTLRKLSDHSSRS